MYCLGKVFKNLLLVCIEVGGLPLYGDHTSPGVQRGQVPYPQVTAVRHPQVWGWSSSVERRSPGQVSLIHEGSSSVAKVVDSIAGGSYDASVCVSTFCTSSLAYRVVVPHHSDPHRGVDPLNILIESLQKVGQIFDLRAPFIVFLLLLIQPSNLAAPDKPH